jgi:hypothetical protein
MFFDACTKPKIDQLDTHLLVNNNILQLNVPMSNILSMKIAQSSSHLLHYVFALYLSKSLLRLLLQSMRKRNPWKVLHDDV